MIHLKGSRAQTYRCAAPGCTWATEPQLFLCLTHWHKVPADLQRDVWSAYRAHPDRSPTRDMLMKDMPWVQSAHAVVSHLAKAQAREVPTVFLDAARRIRFGAMAAHVELG